jgi:hypothetical protein
MINERSGKTAILRYYTDTVWSGCREPWFISVWRVIHSRKRRFINSSTMRSVGCVVLLLSLHLCLVFPKCSLLFSTAYTFHCLNLHHASRSSVHRLFILTTECLIQLFSSSPFILALYFVCCSSSLKPLMRKNNFDKRFNFISP